MCSFDASNNNDSQLRLAYNNYESAHTQQRADSIFIVLDDKKLSSSNISAAAFMARPRLPGKVSFISKKVNMPAVFMFMTDVVFQNIVMTIRPTL